MCSYFQEGCNTPEICIVCKIAVNENLDIREPKEATATEILCESEACELPQPDCTDTVCEIPQDIEAGE